MIAPVLELKLKPAGVELKVPLPVKIGVTALVTDLQKLLLLYVNDADGAAVITTVRCALEAGQGPFAGML